MDHIDQKLYKIYCALEYLIHNNHSLRVSNPIFDLNLKT